MVKKGDHRFRVFEFAFWMGIPLLLRISMHEGFHLLVASMFGETRVLSLIPLTWTWKIVRTDYPKLMMLMAYAGGVCTGLVFLFLAYLKRRSVALPGILAFATSELYYGLCEGSTMMQNKSAFIDGSFMGYGRIALLVPFLVTLMCFVPKYALRSNSANA